MSQALPDEDGGYDCILCRSPLRAKIDAKLLDHESAIQINNYLRLNKEPEVHRNTVSKHRRQHVTAFVRRKAVAIRETARELGVTGGPTNRDLAVLTRDRVVERLIAGDLEPDMNHGLKAQELIDKRAAVSGNRDMILVMFQQAIGGAVALPESIDGEFLELGAGDA